MTTHTIFEFNLDARFMRKVRFKEDEHKLDTSPFLMYASVVSRDSVRIVLILLDIYDLDVKCADV